MKLTNSLLNKVCIILFLSCVFSSDTCVSDSDCKNLSPTFSTLLSNSGGYICVQSQCRFIVKAGELCQVSDDCGSFQYLTRQNSTSSILNSLCSPNYCTLESNCDSAWAVEGKRPLPTTQKCCGGISQNDQCPLDGLHNVDVCASGLSCSVTNDGGSCQSEEQHYQTWIGVILVLLGGSFLNIGLNLQKFALNRHEARLKASQISDCSHQENHVSPHNLAVPLSTFSGSENPDISENQNSFIRDGRLQKIQSDNTSQQNVNSPIMETMSLEIRRVSTVLSHGTKVVALTTRDKLLALLVLWRKSILSPLWLTGLIIYIAASGLNFVALQFAPQSLVGPLGSIALITNIILAPLINKEKLGKTDFLGIILIIGGCVLVVFFSGIVQPNYRLCVLFQLFSRTQTIILLSVIIGLLLLIFIYIKIIEKNIAVVAKSPPIRPASHEPNSLTNETNALKEFSTDRTIAKKSKKSRRCQLFDLDSSVFDVIIPTLSKPISTKSAHYRYLLPLSYAAMGSLMATLTTLFAKTLVNLLSLSIFQDNNQFNGWLSWVILIIVAFTAFSQVYWITLGLRRYDALLQVPVFYVIWTVFDIIGGGIYYNEFEGFTPLKYAMFCLGVGIIFSGVLVLAQRMSSISK